MAYVASTTASFAEPRSLVARSFGALGAFFLHYAEARAHQGEIAELNALSDEELAERGLTRDTIVRHVFTDVLYL